MRPRSRARVPTALLLAVGLGLATALPAQQTDSTTAPARPRREWCPAAVADGARVRAFDPDTRRTHTGTALGWATPAPRLVTAGGDTLALAARHERAVSLGRTGRRKWQGVVVGWLAGVATVVADCGLSSTCGEQNPLPLVGAVLGGVVGNQLKRERWRRAADAACAPGPAPHDA